MSQKPKAPSQYRMASAPKAAARIVEPAVEVPAAEVSAAEEIEPVTAVAEIAPEPMMTAAFVAEVPAVAEEVVIPTPQIETTIPKPAPTPIQGLKTMMKTTEEFVAFGQANVDAFVKSGQIWAAGVQELSKLVATTAKANFDESVTTFKAISTAKSVKEAIDLQSSFAKTAIEKAMAESNKLADASIKLTEQTLAPITARVTVAVEKFGKAA